MAARRCAGRAFRFSSSGSRLLQLSTRPTPPSLLHLTLTLSTHPILRAVPGRSFLLLPFLISSAECVATMQRFNPDGGGTSDGRRPYPAQADNPLSGGAYGHDTTRSTTVMQHSSMGATSPAPFDPTLVSILSMMQEMRGESKTQPQQQIQQSQMLTRIQDEQKQLGNRMAVSRRLSLLPKGRCRGRSRDVNSPMALFQTLAKPH